MTLHTPLTLAVGLSRNEFLVLGVDILYRGSYMSAHVVLHLLNESRKRDELRGKHFISYSQRVELIQ